MNFKNNIKMEQSLETIIGLINEYRGIQEIVIKPGGNVIIEFLDDAAKPKIFESPNEKVFEWLDEHYHKK